jgi:hypothetical protein
VGVFGFLLHNQRSRRFLEWQSSRDWVAPSSSVFQWFISILKTACVQHVARFARSLKTKPLEMARVSSLTGV